MDADTGGRPADHGQIQSGGWVPDPAPIFSCRDIEPEMESVFDTPMETVSGHHLMSRQLFRWTGTDQPIRFNFKFLAGFPVNEPRQAAGLFHERKADGFGHDVESLKATGFDPATVQLHGLDHVGFRPRGKRRAVTRSEVAARFPRRSAGCL